MPTKILKSQNTLRFAQLDKVSSSLDKGVYAVTKDAMTGEYFLTVRDKLKLPEKIYGRNDEFTNRVIKSYKGLKKGMGVLLSGLKGAGKSVASTQICINSDQPILLINSPFADDGFSSFLLNLPCACTIFIDEFEKVYFDREDRDYFLPILDGSSKTNHLFVLTSNSSDIGEFFLSRPGRVRYHKEYFALEDKIIEEIVKDKLENKGNIPKVLDILSKYHGLSIDSVTAIVEESNLHNETPDQFADIFNVCSQRPKFWDIQAEIFDWQIKPGLSDGQLKRVKDEGITEEGDSDFELFYHKVKKKFYCNYCEFLKGPQGKERIDLWVYAEESKDEYCVSWGHTEIKVEETREFIRVIHKDGSTIYATPTSTVKIRSISV